MLGCNNERGSGPKGAHNLLIWAWMLGFEPLGWGLSLKVRLRVSRLGFEPRCWNNSFKDRICAWSLDLSLEAGIWALRLELEPQGISVDLSILISFHSASLFSLCSFLRVPKRVYKRSCLSVGRFFLYAIAWWSHVLAYLALFSLIETKFMFCDDSTGWAEKSRLALGFEGALLLNKKSYTSQTGRIWKIFDHSLKIR